MHYKRLHKENVLTKMYISVLLISLHAVIRKGSAASTLATKTLFAAVVEASWLRC